MPTAASSTANVCPIVYASGTPSFDIDIQSMDVPAKELPDEIVLEAVYNHLRFLKSRGRSVVRADEVARALGLSIAQVERVAAMLHERGVKVEF
ncbi:MAG: hypothetical protein ACE5JJ_05685 [Nitrospinota bacterium]